MKASFLFLILAFFSVLPEDVIAQQVNRTNASYIDPKIGNVGHLLEPTRPLTHLPNQVIRFAPQRKDHFDDQISSFPMTIVSHRLGQVFSVKPAVEEISAASWQGGLTWDYELEINRPWYYSTFLIDKEVTVEFTPGKKSGIFRFHFPSEAHPSILFGTYNGGVSDWKFLSDHSLTGTENYNGDIRVYVYAEFSRPVKKGVIENNQVVEKNEIESENSKSWIQFSKGIKKVELRYAISYISQEQARKNFDAELTNTGFDDLKQKGEKIWNQTMNQINVEGGTEAQKRSFYTAIYRCYERMVDISENGSYYSGFDKQIHRDTRTFYTDDWVWDTYLAHHPLRMILDPKQEEDMLHSYVRMYEQSGWLPTFPVLFGDHACMNGFHSSIVFLDAYRKGLKNFDLNRAYEGMKKNSSEATIIPWRNGPKTQLDEFYHTAGYFPALRDGEKETEETVHHFEKRQAVAITLGTSYDDWAVSQLAKDLGKKDDERLFAERAKNYLNLWNPEKQMFLPKDAAGKWINIDPKFDGGPGGRDYYDENNGYTYMWQVQQDIPSLISLMGGKNSFENKLDQLFREGLDRSKQDFWYKFPDATGLVGQFSMGNEPSFHIPYLYNYTDAPWKTQRRIRFLLDTWFKDNIFGIPGDEDGGGMSAFVVFSSMGFYPITPGSPVYTIGSPVFSKVSIALKNGKQFTLTAKNCSVVNKYIQRAMIDGKVLNTPFFSHEQLMNGGNLVIEMGPKPNKQWGVVKK